MIECPLDVLPYIGPLPAPDQVCEQHRSDVEERWREVDEYEAWAQVNHPDGHCTDSCGCMTLEQLRRSLGLPDAME